MTASQDIVFAKTRTQYDSYTDFWHLVSLSGFSTCYFEEIRIDQPKCFIFTPWNGEVTPHLQNELASGRPKHATIIWWCLERFDAMGKPHKDVLSEASPLVDQIWVSDRWLSTWDPRFKYVTLGSHPGLGNSKLEPKYDFTHQSYAWGRRENMYNLLKNMGLLEGRSCYGDERDQILRSSRLMLNLQQYPDPVTAPLRFALAAAYHLPVVSETIRDPFPLDGLLDLSDYDGIPATVSRVLSQDNSSTVHALYETLCVEHNFRRAVDAST